MFLSCNWFSQATFLMKVFFQQLCFQMGLCRKLLPQTRFAVFCTFLLVAHPAQWTSFFPKKAWFFCLHPKTKETIGKKRDCSRGLKKGASCCWFKVVLSPSATVNNRKCFEILMEFNCDIFLSKMKKEHSGERKQRKDSKLRGFLFYSEELPQHKKSAWFERKWRIRNKGMKGIKE